MVMTPRVSRESFVCCRFYLVLRMKRTVFRVNFMSYNIDLISLSTYKYEVQISAIAIGGDLHLYVNKVHSSVYIIINNRNKHLFSYVSVLRRISLFIMLFLYRIICASMCVRTKAGRIAHAPAGARVGMALELG